jgi:hypothetical protein
MDADLLMVMGMIVCTVAVLSLISAWIDGRISRVGPALLLIGGVLVVVAIGRHPGGYTIAALPEVFLEVFMALMGRYVK